MEKAPALVGGHGLLMRAPQRIAELTVEIVEAFGARATIVKSGVGHDPGKHLALVMDRNFIIASAFRFTNE